MCVCLFVCLFVCCNILIESRAEVAWVKMHQEMCLEVVEVQQKADKSRNNLFCAHIPHRSRNGSHAYSDSDGHGHGCYCCGGGIYSRLFEYFETSETASTIGICQSELVRTKKKTCSIGCCVCVCVCVTLCDNKILPCFFFLFLFFLSVFVALCLSYKLNAVRYARVRFISFFGYL